MRKSALPTVPARYLVWAMQLAEARATDCSALPAVGGLTRAQLEAPDAMVSQRQFDAMLHRLVLSGAHSELGFELGMQLNLSSHDLLGYALLSSTTLDVCLRLTQRYYRLITPSFRLQYQRLGEEAELLFTPVQPMMPETLYFHEEAIAVATYRHLCSLLQRPLARGRIFLSMPQPRHAARYRELGGVPVQFQASALPGVRIVLAASELDLRLPLANERARATAEHHCRQLMQHVKQQSSWKDWVAMMLNAAVDCQPKLDELAGLLNIAGRTLDRYLRKEGTTFRVLALEIRNRRAQALLGDDSLPVSQIAYRLGYTDVANFGHAFRAMNGCSPSDYRRARAALKECAAPSSPS
ncbi:AraC family transcriptional regulator [Pseudoduganella sp. OTU4001]|uniref:AraC family transcriptional regulator n=1 Tax=Pseudoduganella sp. OTU4001 TaxID=3043854 RepID=UPI00313C6F4E